MVLDPKGRWKTSSTGGLILVPFQLCVLGTALTSLPRSPLLENVDDSGPGSVMRIDSKPQVTMTAVGLCPGQSGDIMGWKHIRLSYYNTAHVLASSYPEKTETSKLHHTPYTMGTTSVI